MLNCRKSTTPPARVGAEDVHSAWHPRVLLLALVRVITDIRFGLDYVVDANLPQLETEPMETD